ncbi:MAG: hypothetical protein ACP5JH_12035 [Bacteroidota bacterium]
MPSLYALRAMPPGDCFVVAPSAPLLAMTLHGPCHCESAVRRTPNTTKGLRRRGAFGATPRNDSADIGLSPRSR